MTKRSEFEIKMDILDVVARRDGINRYHLYRSVNVSSNQGKSLVIELVEKGFLVEKVRQAGSVKRYAYRITRKGLRVVQDYKVIRKALSTE